MTFSKAANLLRVADMATSRYDGIRLQDVTDEFACDHRTAQCQSASNTHPLSAPNIDPLGAELARRCVVSI